MPVESASELGRHLLEQPDWLQTQFQPVVGFDTLDIIAADTHLRAQISGVRLASEELALIAHAAGCRRQIMQRVLMDACGLAAVGGRVTDRPLIVMVDVTAAELGDPDFLADTVSVLQTTGVPPGHLWFEFGEDVLLDRSSQIEGTLEGLCDVGICLSLDRFGAGHASLTHLRAAPLTSVKLDRRLTHRVDSDGPDREVARSVIRVAHACGLRTIADGVATQSQRDALATMGCDAWQGPLRSLAVYSEEFVGMLQGSGRSRAAASWPVDVPVTEAVTPELDSFVLRRIATTRWAHVGGEGRGEAWAGIVEVDEGSTPVLALAGRGQSSVELIKGEEHGWLFGLRRPGVAAVVPLDSDTVVVFGSGASSTLPRLSDAQWKAEASALVNRVWVVSPAKRLADELELSESLQTLLSRPPSTLEEAMHHVIESAIDALSCDVGMLYLRNEGRFVSGGGADGSWYSPQVVRALDGLVSNLRSPICHQGRDGEFLPIEPDGVARSWLALPTAPQLGGILILGRPGRQVDGFSLLGQRIGKRLADAAEFVLHAAAERERLNALADDASTAARTDALTGIPNRLGWTEALARCQHNPHQRGTAVMMFDLNNLKLVNDNEGHEAGDRLITTAAQVLSSLFRSSDTIARLGGDEFAALLPGADDAVCHRVLSQLDRCIERERRDHPALSIAVGFAVTSEHRDLVETIAVADEHMYEHKREMKSKGASR